MSLKLYVFGHSVLRFLAKLKQALNASSYQEIPPMSCNNDHAQFFSLLLKETESCNGNPAGCIMYNAMCTIVLEG